MIKRSHKSIATLISLGLIVVLIFNLIGCNNKNSHTHSYGEWVIDTPATCTMPGTKYKKCFQCEDKQFESISPLQHNFVNGVCVRCGEPQDGNIGKDPPVTDVAKVRLSLNQPNVGSEVFPIEEIEANSVIGYNVTIEKNNDFGLSSYKTSNLNVSYDTNSNSYGVMDTLTVDDDIAVEQGYYVQESGELALGEIYSDYYEVEIDYTSDGKVEGLYYYDTYYTYKYNDNGSPIEIYKNGDLYKQFAYNGNGNIVSELVKYDNENKSNIYSYTTSGELYSVNNKTVHSQYTVSGNTIELGERTYNFNSSGVRSVSGDCVAQFTYGYEFNNNKFLTNKTVDGITTSYSYVGDRLVELRNSIGTVDYILDNGLNYIGLKYDGEKYYFAVDPYGNVMGLLDCDGEVKVAYEYDIWGNIESVTGELANTLGELNEIVSMNGIYDFALGVYFFANNVYAPMYGITLQSGSEHVVQVKSMYEWEQSGYFARSAVSSFACIHDKVVEAVVDNLKQQGMDLTSNLYAVDKAGNNKRLVDIYTLDYSITPFSAMNLVDGNQIYEVVYHDPDSQFFAERAQDKINDICKDWAVSYFSEYEPVPGTMKFHGQFIYLDYLIDYKSSETIGGIVEYQVKKNIKNNYDLTVNIYNYDTNRYVNFVNNTFDLDFLDSVTIIPGITRETYDVIDGFLADKLQAVAGNVCDQMLIYDDPSYYDALQANNAKDYWSQMNLSDTTTYLEIQDDGSVKVKTMPVWETDGFVTKLLIGAGVILVTAVVATIAVSIPGLNCVVVSICVGTAKGAIAGALSGFAFGAVSGAAGELIGQLASGQTVDWEKIANAAAGAAADGFMSGAITGAIMGGIQGGLKPTYCFEAGTPVATSAGAVAIENVAVGDSVLSYDYITGEQSYKTVTATSVRQTKEVIELTVGDEQIVTTARHPFYVVNNDKYYGYTTAELLSVGDCIMTSDGNYAEITDIENRTLAEPMTVYNLTVEDNHSYYVGENELLVHNVNGCNTDVNQLKQFRDEKKLYQHYGKHVNAKGEFGNITIAEYLSKAQNLADSPQFLVKTLANGEQVFYNQAANEFLKLSSDGFIKTFFRPEEGINYLKFLGYL